MAQPFTGSAAVQAAAVTTTPLAGVTVGGIQTTLDLDYGCDHSLAFTVYTTEALTAIQDMLGWALSFMVKRSLDDADAAAVLTKTTGNGITISGTYHQNPSSNTQRATVALTAANLTIDPRNYCWELQRTDSGHKTRLAHGLLCVAETVHRT